MFTRCYNLWYGRYFIILLTNILFYISARVEENLRNQNKYYDYRDPKIYLQHHHLTNWTGILYSKTKLICVCTILLLGISWPSTLEDLNRIEENNSTYAINVLLAPADAKDEIVKKNCRKQKQGNQRRGRPIPEDEEKGKFQRVTNVTTIRTSKHNDREHQINLLMIHKVCFKK